MVTGIKNAINCQDGVRMVTDPYFNTSLQNLSASSTDMRPAVFYTKLEIFLLMMIETDRHFPQLGVDLEVFHVSVDLHDIDMIPKLSEESLLNAEEISDI